MTGSTQLYSRLHEAFDIDRFVRDLDLRLRGILCDRVEVSERALLSVTVAVPELVHSNFQSFGKDYVYWSRPRDQHCRIGAGRAVVLEAHGERRFELLNRAFVDLCKGWTALESDSVDRGRWAFVGFSFYPGEAAQQGHWHGLASALLFVPTVLLERKRSACNLTFTARWMRGCNPDAIRERWVHGAHELVSALMRSPAPPTASGRLVRDGGSASDDEWLSRVQAALRAIRAGALEKVVVTRRVHVAKSRPLELSRVLAWLESHYPECVQFALSGDDCCLVGASPERLVALEGDAVVADAVAGTATENGNLLRDQKARKEQDLVVSEIMRALGPFCTNLNVPPVPRLLTLPTLQHLWSPICGRVRSEVSLLQLASRLHPTPAVGGVPRRKALAWLAQQGEDWRGWYTGALGWLNADGGGELSVVLRCAVLNKHKAELFAGSGIVADSDPAQELAETEWKLRTMLDALAVA